MALDGRAKYLASGTAHAHTTHATITRLAESSPTPWARSLAQYLRPRLSWQGCRRPWVGLGWPALG